MEFYDVLKEIKVLYAEDDGLTRKLITSLLKKFFKNITVCKDGEEAFKEFQKNHYDIVITDIVMPKLDGIGLIKKIRSKNKDVSIIITSAYGDLQNLQEAINLGIDGFLIKPVDEKQLSSVLKRVLLKYICNKKRLETEHYLKQFEEAVNESAIISKTDPKGIITYVNDNFVKTSKYSKEELIGKSHNIVRHPDMPKEFFQKMWEDLKNHKTFKGIIKNKDKNGKSYYVKTVIKPIVDLKGNLKEYLAVREDITEYMNPKKMFLDALNARTKDILVYMKLKNYEELEEFYPFDIVEKIEKLSLKFIYRVFNKHFFIKEIFPLTNGEFAVFLDKKFLDDNLIDNLKKIQHFIKSNSIVINEDVEYDIHVFMSVVYEGDKIYESAKIGLKYLLKENKDFIVANDLAKTHFIKAQENLKKIQLIKNAIKNKRIINFYQGIVNNKTKKIEKYESLVRLVDEKGQILSPFFFLEAAKKGNYYPQITNIVIENAFNVLKKIKEDVSINLSFLDIEIDSIREKIYDLLKNNSEVSHRIVFEILEDENIENIDLVREFIFEVKKYGVKIAIDDFGSGYSNYIRLIDFKVDILKIDGSLIKNIETDNFSKSIIKSIVTFAKENNLQTVAEFVENENIAKIVTDLGIDYSQGYYYSKPQPL